ncbi:hypothetical protein GOV03_02975 [Candidatus Woesearchaeota archaeon]|nr:hypothetical protein [Candidatus Woesearchaeota archaeon]
MARIDIENIREVDVTVNLEERTFNSETIHPAVKARYVAEGYDQQPKNKAERNAMNAEIFIHNLTIKNEADKIPPFKGWNGLMSSCTSIETEPTAQGNIVRVSISPTRYLLREAMEKVWREGNYTTEQTRELSPDMAGTSLIAPVRIKGEYFLLSQIKGDALGSGQIHAGLVAGGIDAFLLTEDNPLLVTLKKETIEEMGIDLSDLDHSSFIYVVDERKTGQVNFAAVARNVDPQFVFDRYEADTKTRLAAGEKLEVAGLAELPVAGVALVPLKNGELGLGGITCYMPTKDGLVEAPPKDRGIRPYTQATLDYLTKSENVKFLLEKAGF